MPLQTLPNENLWHKQNCLLLWSYNFNLTFSSILAKMIRYFHFYDSSLRYYPKVTSVCNCSYFHFNLLLTNSWKYAKCKLPLNVRKPFIVRLMSKSLQHLEKFMPGIDLDVFDSHIVIQFNQVPLPNDVSFLSPYCFIQQNLRFVLYD